MSKDNTLTKGTETKPTSAEERPILFSAPMVRALLDGSKTQTRRIVKPHRADDAFVLLDHGDGWWPYRSEDGESANVDNMEYPFACPYGRPGQRLWVRETWAPHPDFPELARRAVYRADPECEHDVARWHPCIHMRGWASRIQLEVVAVRVERLHDCSEADAQAEGVLWLQCVDWMGPNGTRREIGAQIAYRKLWESINGAGSWAANPWVWVVEFKRVRS